MSQAPLLCDLLVIGSGAGGLSAAVAGAALGLNVVLAEKEPLVGGTTAMSGGWMWVPGNHLARAAGIEESIEEPMAYLRHELGRFHDEERLLAYLEHAPRMLEFFEQRSQLRFVDGNAIPDFHGNSPHAATGGRSVCAAPFDARALGDWRDKLKPPLPETTLWGMGLAAGADLRHFLDATRSPRSLAYVTRRLARHGADLLAHGNAMQLRGGQALAGALLATALQAKVDLRLQTQAKRLLVMKGRVVGAQLSTPEQDYIVHASRGVVLACGGFPHDGARIRQLLPHAPSGAEHWSAASGGNTGDGLRMGEAAGGQVARDLVQAAALAPVSLVPRGEGRHAHFPHLAERGKPGLIAVLENGQRFVNEADSYHDFMAALLRATPEGVAPRAWLICDHVFIRRWGLGAAKPAPFPVQPWVDKGYLTRANTLDELAAACNMNPYSLKATVETFNRYAARGVDESFHKGETPYNRMQGDAAHSLPNACMAPIAAPPFYALQVLPGSLGTFAGLAVNPHAQVLGNQGAPITGLYAAGNDANSLFGGHYPSGGITLGPAMTFGYLAAHHAAGAAPLPPRSLDLEIL